MNINMTKVALTLSLLSVCVAAAQFSTTPAATQSDGLLFLVQDFKAFDQTCPGPASSYSPSCADQLAGLQRREQDLHVSDADVAKAILAFDFSGFARHCSGPSSNSASCTDQAAALQRQQQDLHMSDADVRDLQAKMGIAGGLRAGRWE